jgi:hypothetical protein
MQPDTHPRAAVPAAGRLAHEPLDAACAQGHAEE